MARHIFDADGRRVGIVLSDREVLQREWYQLSLSLAVVLIPAALYLWPAAIPAYVVNRFLWNFQVHPLVRALACIATVALIVYVVTRSAVLVALYFGFVGVALGATATGLILIYTQDLVWTVSGGLVLSFLALWCSLRFSYVFSPLRKRREGKPPSDTWQRVTLISSGVLSVLLVGGIALFSADVLRVAGS